MGIFSFEITFTSSSIHIVVFLPCGDNLIENFRTIRIFCPLRQDTAFRIGAALPLQLCKQGVKVFLVLGFTDQVVGDGGVRVGDGDEDPAGWGFLVMFPKFRGEERQ